MKLIDIPAVIRHETDKVYLLYDGRSEIKNGDTVPSELRVWVAKSQVEDNGDGTFTYARMASFGERIYLK